MGMTLTTLMNPGFPYPAPDTSAGVIPFVDPYTMPPSPFVWPGLQAA